MARGRFIDVDPSPQNLRAIWDQIHRMRDDLTAAQATITQQAATIADQQTQLAAAARAAQQALITAGSPTTTVTAGGSVTPGGGGTPPLSDGGLGEQGCGQAGSDGHVVDPPSLVTLGKIVCGTGAEFPALLAVAVDQPTRDANRFELLGRMIWHINLAGFTACSRYPGNPYDLLVQLGSTQYAYRVVGYETFETPMTTVMVYGGQTPGGSTIPDPGISD